MTDQQHPITPPSGLLSRWEDDILNERENVDFVLDCAWKDGFRAGADQELEACCECLIDWDWDEGWSDKLYAARRPKSTRLAEEAQKALAHLLRHSSTELGSETIRRALERLQELEGQDQLTKESD